MSFRRNAGAQGRYHRGAASVEEADKQDPGLHGRAMATIGGGNVLDTRDSATDDDLVLTVAVPLYTVALRAAAKAKDELDFGVVWEFDATVAKIPVTSDKIRWKRFDEATEMSVESGFQANSDQITLSSTTWSLGEEFLRREGDGAASLRFVPETVMYGRESWHGMQLINHRAGRTKRVRRYYKLDDLAPLDTARLQELVQNIGRIYRINAAGCMQRDELFKALVAQELACPRTKRKQHSVLPTKAGLATEQEELAKARALATKECYNLVYQTSDRTTGVANVMEVLGLMRDRAIRRQEAAKVEAERKKKVKTPASQELWPAPEPERESESA